MATFDELILFSHRGIQGHKLDLRIDKRLNYWYRSERYPCIRSLPESFLNLIRDQAKEVKPGIYICGRLILAPYRKVINFLPVEDVMDTGRLLKVIYEGNTYLVTNEEFNMNKKEDEDVRE